MFKKLFVRIFISLPTPGSTDFHLRSAGEGLGQTLQEAAEATLPKNQHRFFAENKQTNKPELAHFLEIHSSIQGWIPVLRGLTLLQVLGPLQKGKHRITGTN